MFSLIVSHGLGVRLKLSLARNNEGVIKDSRTVKELERAQGLDLSLSERKARKS
jgi:hypothetical protein